VFADFGGLPLQSVNGETARNAENGGASRDPSSLRGEQSQAREHRGPTCDAPSALRNSARFAVSAFEL